MGSSKSNIRVQGFVQHIRALKNLTFIVVRPLTESSSEPKKVQFVYKENANQNLNQKIRLLKRQSYVTVEGCLEDPEDCKSFISASLISLEILATSKEILGEPLTKKDTPEYEKNFEVLEFRKFKYHQILYSRALLYKTIRKILDNTQYVELTTPKLLAQSSEGGAELFSVDATNTNYDLLYLAQSPQLFKQAAINIGLKRVYQIGNIYRAQKFKTSRHLHEATCLDLECVTNTLSDVTNVLIEIICAYTKDLNQNHLEVDLVVPDDFKTISYTKAIEILQLPLNHELTNQNQKELVKRLNCKFVFVTEYPPFQKPFYIHKNQSFDLLCSTGELSSGGLRQNNQDVLIAQIKEKNLNAESLKWYTDSFSLGCPMSGGFGFGLDRLIAYVHKLPTIKHTKIFPAY